MTPSVDSTHRGEWFALLFHVTSVMITFHVTVEIQLKELHEWFIAYLQLRTSVVYLFKTNEPLKWWLLFFVKRQISSSNIWWNVYSRKSWQFWIWSCGYMKIMYVNCGVKEDHRSYIHKFYSCEKKAWKKKPESFSGFLFPAAKVAHITAMIFLHVVLNLLPAVENQNWHWPGPVRCDRLLIINKLFRDPTPYIRKSPSL